MQRLGIIIVNYRTPKLAIACIRSIEAARSTFPALRVVVVDGGSADGSVEEIAAAIAGLDWVTLLPLQVNGGFAFANNQGIASLTAAGALPDAIALINPDARVLPGALEAMAALLERTPRAGAVGGLLVHETGQPQPSAFNFPTLRREFARGARTHVLERLLHVPPTIIASDHAIDVPWVTGAAVMFRTAALEASGLFDDGFFLYFEETDLMRRLRWQGWSIWHEPAARVVHVGGAATNAGNLFSAGRDRVRVPRYWYESRRRYFALARGRGFALLAGAVWLLGDMWWKARQIVAPQVDQGPLRISADLVAYGLWPTRDDKPSVPGLRDPARAAPAWMRQS